MPDLLWGHKTTTEHVAGIDLDAFARRTPPVIFISRNKADCIDSKMRRAGQTREKATEKWAFAVSVLETLRSAGVPMLQTAYEALVDNPEREMRSVCEFLGIPYDATMLSGADSEKMPPQYRR